MSEAERSRTEAAVSTISTVPEGSESDAPAGSPPAEAPATQAATPASSPPADSPSVPATAAPAAGTATSAANTRRSIALTIPIPTAVVGALVAGMFGLLFFSLNGLRADIASTNSSIDSLRSDMTGEIGALRADTTGQINSLRAETTGQINSLRAETTGQIDSLRSDMNQRFSEVDQRFVEVNQRFAEIHGILLGHSDRLARIETRLGIEFLDAATAADEAAGQQHMP